MISLITLLGATTPCVVLAIILRRWFAPLPWQVTAIALFLGSVFLAPGFLSTRILVPVDEVARGYPFHGIVGEVHVRNALTNDTVKQILPWMQLVREQFSSLNWPLWNRYQFSGYPLLGNGQSAPFGPFFLVTLLVPLPKQLVAMAFVKLFVSFIFTFLLLKDEGRSDGAALFGAALFSFSVFETVYLFYPLTSVSALLPLLLWSLRRTVQSSQLRWPVLLSLCAVSALTGGHPETVVHLAIAGVMIVGIDLIAGEQELRHLAAWYRIGWSIVMAVGISAPAWLPVAQQVSLSRRFNEIATAGHVFTFPIQGAWLALNPNGFGHPARGSWNWILNYSMVAPTYVGLLGLALGIASLASRSRRALFFFVTALALFTIAMNWTVIAHVVNAVPPLSFCANDRLRFVSVLFIAIASAYALDHFGRGIKALFVLASAALFLAATWVFVKKLGVTLEPRDAVGIAMILLFAGAAELLRLRDKQRAIPHLAFGCLCIELFAFNSEFNSSAPQRYYRMSLPIMNALRSNAPSEPFRIVGFDWVLMPNAAAQYGLEDIRGSDPMEFDFYRQFFKLIEFPQSDDVKRVQDIGQPGLAFLNVRFAMTEPGLGEQPGWHLRYAGADGKLYESTSALRRFFVPLRYSTGPSTLPRLRSIRSFAEEVIVEGDQGALQTDAARVGAIRQNQTGTRFSFTVDATAPTLIASSQPFTPGWRVKVNGYDTRSYRVNGAFIGFMVPTGHSDIMVYYLPISFYIGLLLCLTTAVASCVFVWRGSLKRSSKSPSTASSNR